MASGDCSRKPVKIVIIDTQYVETDAMSFKSVVQKLTGKDSDHVAPDITEARKAKRERHSNVGVVDVPCAYTQGSFLIMDSSLKEFEKLLREMPPLNDDLWSD
ncbi:hypothetical protein SESBI_11176 [Sesbania bispinosa]|nr:hypothetical protein SESBI_11176 [Sesbania bispinosa]